MHDVVRILVASLFLVPVYGQGEVEKLPASVNTEAYDESSPVLSKDGKVPVFYPHRLPGF
jgi:hypothetical protein